MFDTIEVFFRAHQYTTAALGVAATFSAVILSLVLALVSQRANRTRIKARASISVILHSTLEGKAKPTHVTVFVRNVGIMPVMIPFSFFHWRVPFGRAGWLVNPWDSQGDKWVPKKTYPVEIKPRSSENFFLGEISVFRTELRNMFAGANFLQRLRFRFLRARVLTDDGRMFNVILDRSLRKELRTLCNGVP
jgi:hypothetical protein